MKKYLAPLIEAECVYDEDVLQLSQPGDETVTDIFEDGWYLN